MVLLACGGFRHSCPASLSQCMLLQPLISFVILHHRMQPASLPAVDTWICNGFQSSCYLFPNTAGCCYFSQETSLPTYHSSSGGQASIGIRSGSVTLFSQTSPLFPMVLSWTLSLAWKRLNVSYPSLTGSREESKKTFLMFMNFLNSVNFEIAGLALSRVWGGGSWLCPVISKFHLDMLIAFWECPFSYSTFSMMHKK